MEVLDHFEESPKATLRSRVIKTLLLYGSITFVIVQSVFIGHGLGWVDPFPLFEQPAGWFIMTGLFCATLYLYQKVIVQLRYLLLASFLGWFSSGFVAVLITGGVLNINSDEYILMGILLWIFYILVALAIFRGLYKYRRRRYERNNPLS